MQFLLVVVCVAFFIWTIRVRKKIDKEEEVALKTPGRANRLRAQYGILIERLLEDPKHVILFEREYDELIRMANSHNQELFISRSFGDELVVACFQDSLPIQSWKFRKTDSISAIYREITDYFI